MGGSEEPVTVKSSSEGQCQFFVVRKKRLCRMTVRPGRRWCGEHEPRPPTELSQTDKRIPCPYDPKHTCYTSKLEKHLTICNARPEELPPYIIPDVNVPKNVEPLQRRPLTEVPKETLLSVIEKINRLYAEHIEGNISTLPEREIHPVVMPEFSDGLRAETSRRHLRQASALLHLAEQSGLVADRTCYVELGAGKGQLSYYVSNAWCGPASLSGLVLVDRAALRHKRDARLTPRRLRLRADLRHLALQRLAQLDDYDAVVGLAKHLCGVATDYALRCMAGTGAGAGAGRARGLVMATCCHHRCESAAYTGRPYLEELGIIGEELNIILSVVSWATCGDGRARHTRRARRTENGLVSPSAAHRDHQLDQFEPHEDSLASDHGDTRVGYSEKSESREKRADCDSHNKERESLVRNNISGDSSNSSRISTNKDSNKLNEKDEVLKLDESNDVLSPKQSETDRNEEILNPKDSNDANDERLNLSLCERESVGRRAKALVDWGRVLYLRAAGWRAALWRYVPAAVSPENVCIVATKTHL